MTESDNTSENNDFEIDLGAVEESSNEDDIEIDLGVCGAEEDDETDVDIAPLTEEGEDEDSDEEDLDKDDAVAKALDELRARLESEYGDWYVIHTYSGMENRVKQNLEQRVTSLNM